MCSYRFVGFGFVGLECCTVGEFPGYLSIPGESIHEIDKCRACFRIVAIVGRGFDLPFPGMRLMQWVIFPECFAYLFLRCHGFAWFGLLGFVLVAAKSVVFLISEGLELPELLLGFGCIPYQIS